MTQCLKETMRFYPPVPAIQRVLEKDTVINDKVLPAGTDITIHIYALHHNPEVWPNDMVRYEPSTLGELGEFLL